MEKEIIKDFEGTTFTIKKIIVIKKWRKKMMRKKREMKDRFIQCCCFIIELYYPSFTICLASIKKIATKATCERGK